MRALLSVYDKTGIVEFGRGLVELGWELLSTGGTHRALKEAGLPVIQVADITGFPEILDGRVKTLHPMIHGGLLARLDNPNDLKQLSEHDVTPIGLLAANLYPFEQTVRSKGATHDDIIENIDIGGPAMLRAAAKNHHHVLPVCEPRDYSSTLARLRKGAVSLEFRQQLAARAFAHTSAYDSLVTEYLRSDETDWPETLNLAGRKTLELRYGENPHQSAAAYELMSTQPGQSGLLSSRKIQGKDLSYNNLLDGDAALNAVQDWGRPTVAIVKHTIPCGLSEAEELMDAFDGALSGDPVSAFGGIVAANREIDLDTANRIATVFFEVVIAPSFSSEALEILSQKKNLRLLEIGRVEAEPKPTADIRSIRGGLLVQEQDSVANEASLEWEVRTERAPSPAELADLEFAWKVCAMVKSNAIVLAKNHAILSVGSGQPNRVESVGIAVRKAEVRVGGSVLASDAFFPFADGIEAAAAAGVSAVIQPGGSRRDGEVIEAANRANIAMVFTGRRHFRH